MEGTRELTGNWRLRKVEVGFWNRRTYHIVEVEATKTLFCWQDMTYSPEFTVWEEASPEDIFNLKIPTI